MAKYIAYVGEANFREVGAHDLVKAGVEDPDEYLFERGVPTKLEETDADALLEHELFRGEFAVVEEPQPDELDYEDWGKDQLIDELKSRDLPHTGKKADLVERLKDHDDIQALEGEPVATGADSTSGPTPATPTSTATSTT